MATDREYSESVPFRVEEESSNWHNAALNFPPDFLIRHLSGFLLWQPKMDRERIERQLKLAEQRLSAWEKQLDADKVAAEKRGRNPKWRSLDADVRALKRRIIAVKQIEDREEAALARKNETAAATEE